jgi:RNA polymerase sigma-70 factor (TIGR02957 family)
MGMYGEAADVFEEHRKLLFGVAYRMLGSVAEADDVIQETWLRWDGVDHSQVAEPKAYLVRVATTAALDHLRRARTRAENYVGPWLPEPLLTGPDVANDAVLSDSVSMAMLVVLETLSPLERAVFVLKEAFGFSYPEIGEALGRSEQAARQLGHRAREHVQARRPRFKPDRKLRQAATKQFLQAAIGGDLRALLEILAPDVRLVVDGGGRIRAPRQPLEGAGRVARFLAQVAGDIPAGTQVHYVDINGEPAAVATLQQRPYVVFVLEVDPDSGRVEVIRIVGNPSKLSGLPPVMTASGQLDVSTVAAPSCRNAAPS